MRRKALRDKIFRGNQAHLMADLRTRRRSERLFDLCVEHATHDLTDLHPKEAEKQLCKRVRAAFIHWREEKPQASKPDRFGSAWLILAISIIAQILIRWWFDTDHDGKAKADNSVTLETWREGGE